MQEKLSVSSLPTYRFRPWRRRGCGVLHHRGAHELVSERCIAVGWPDAGDSSDLPDDREAFKRRIRNAFPDRSEAWVANAAGQLLRFRHVMQIDEIVVYSRKSDRTINIGRIAGAYAYEPGSGAGIRTGVPSSGWKRRSRAVVSPAAVSTRSDRRFPFTRSKEHKQEILRALTGEVAAGSIVVGDRCRALAAGAGTGFGRRAGCGTNRRTDRRLHPQGVQHHPEGSRLREISVAGCSRRWDTQLASARRARTAA